MTSVESALIGWGPGSGAVTWFETHFRGNVLPVYQPHYAQAVAIFLVFLGVVLLNVFADRFWCRYLCPLGALLGLVAKVQVLRPLVGDGCNRLRRLRARLPCRTPSRCGGATARRARRRGGEAAAPAPASSPPSARCASTASSPARSARR